jgi:photosystem II stability/assembly factor-like uncharacterized protein
MKSLISNFVLIFTFSIFLSNFSFSQGTVNEHSIKFDASNTSSAILVGEDGVILKTNDNGASWQRQQSNISNVLYGNIIVDANTSYVVGENGMLLKTTDGGDSWNILNTGTTEHLKDIEVFGPSNMVICGENGTILTSNDMGETWSIQNITGNNLNDIINVNGEALIIAGDNSTLLKSLDGGYTWQQLPVYIGGLTMNLKGVGATDQDHITIVGNSSFIYYSTDGGLIWQYPVVTSYNSNLNLNSVVIFNTTDGIIVGDDGLILITADGGLTWNTSATPGPTTRDLMSVAFSSITSGITVGETGYSLFTTDGGATWTDTYQGNKLKNNHSKFPKVLVVNPNYPNPFNPTTTITYQIGFDANVSVKVYDILGKQVASLFTGFQKEGSYKFQFNASALSSGVYFYRISAEAGANKFEKVMKMLLTK